MTDETGIEGLLSRLESQRRNDPDEDLVRRCVRLRAHDACEYCLRRTENPFHVDHIIPSALWRSYVAGQIDGVLPVGGRRGPDHLDNFAWCCPLCNRSKSQQVAVQLHGQSQRLFDPRQDSWPEHFIFVSRYIFIVGVTPLGLATEQALALNRGGLGGPLGTRHEAIVDGRYPPEWARAWKI